MHRSKMAEVSESMSLETMVTWHNSDKYRRTDCSLRVDGNWGAEVSSKYGRVAKGAITESIWDFEVDDEIDFRLFGVDGLFDLILFIFWVLFFEKMKKNKKIWGCKGCFYEI